ncbi:pitrilysin family protein [Saccharibacillus sp. CPCC 101409]|uniref:M16 family metallopeptidase n=1 Tax=Saccharibacillus sp. CPCC 101409 TaxID=3058041 RepID=UPI0026734D70|nr:pitrilysin family protein [Saccharibacillus sp. CPCC 101409]MDO3409721.1 pitrilysin family protein [Saccharibacillus sp. CPCC 101409]
MDRSGIISRRLSSGLEIVYLPLPGLSTVSIGLLAGAGTRVEEDDEIGSSRILEHWIWQREPKQKDDRKILADFGANLKTASNIEWTRHWTTVLCNQFESVFELFVQDILKFDCCFETFSASKDYITSLSNKRQREPNTYIMDALREKMAGGQKIGRSAAGSAEDMIKLNLPKVKTAYERLYVPSNCVVAVVGGISAKRLDKLLDKLNQIGTAQGSRKVPAEEFSVWRSGVYAIEQEGKLVHLAAGVPCASCAHHDFFASAVLSQAMGGGDGSKLFDRIRQKKGAAYQVRSSLMSFRDTGLLTFYLATEADFVPWATCVIIDEIEKIKKEGLPEEKVKIAKNQLLKHMVLRSESTASRMNTLLTALWYPGYPGTLAAMKEAIGRVTSEDIQSTLQNIVPATEMGIVTLGPFPPRRWH